MVARPTSFIGWTDGSNSKVAQPPSNYALQGFTAGQAPAYQYVNWLLYTLDQWCQYLDGKGGGSGGGNSSITSNPRLINGGTWTLGSTNTMAWSASFNVAIPGQADASNVVASGGVTLTDGQVAYVNLNIPFSYTATLTSGSASITNLSSTAGLSVGMAVSGTGIPASTTISSISGTTVVLNNAASASGSGSVVTFQSSGTLTAQTATESSLSAGPQTAIFARNVAGVFIVGIGAGEMQLRPGEAKALRGNGFGASFTGTAGFAITAGQACYVSPGGLAEGRSAGSVFTTDVSSSSVTNTPARVNCVGIATQSVASGQAVTLLMNGIIGGFSGLTIGQPVYLDPSVIGGLTQTYPGNVTSSISANGIVLVGMAISATQVYVKLPASNDAIPLSPTFNNVTCTNFAATTISATRGFRMIVPLGGYATPSDGSGWVTGGSYLISGSVISTYQAFQAGVIEAVHMAVQGPNTNVGTSNAATLKIYEVAPGVAIAAGAGSLVGTVTVPGVTTNGSVYTSTVAANVATKQGYSYYMTVNPTGTVPTFGSGVKAFGIGVKLQLIC